MKKFEQMKRQYRSLVSYLDLSDLSDRNISATTADFDRLFELTWKTLKSYLFDTLGILDAKTGSPREILKLAAREELIQQDEVWLSMLKDRNDDSHIYRKADAVLYISKIADLYLPEVKALIHLLEGKIPAEQFQDTEIPADLLEYALANHEPLYLLVERLKAEYGCQTENEVFKIWKMK